MENVAIATSVTVVGIEVVQRGGRVRHVRAVRRNGQRLEVAADNVVLACGAIENARLLLLSGIGGSPWLGRGFMEHARDFSLVLAPDSRAVFARAGFYDLFTAPDGTRLGGRLALTDAALEAHDLPNASLTLIPGTCTRGKSSRIERMLRRFRSRYGAHRRGRYGWSSMPDPDRAFDHFRLVLNLEQRADRRNRITLSGRRDRHGNPLPALHLEWFAEEQRRLDRLRELLARWFREADLGRLQFEFGRQPDLRAHHHAGTTRMAEHVGDGVVDTNCAVFATGNLFVAGASVFPTAGFANPTLTIVALSLRLAEHLRSR